MKYQNNNTNNSKTNINNNNNKWMSFFKPKIFRKFRITVINHSQWNVPVASIC